MSRLDQHVNLVRNKIALDGLLRAWALAGTALASAVLLAVLVERLTRVHLPRGILWFWAGLVAAVIAPVVWSFVRRPSAQQAAVAIDERLGLKEKFSTALYVRPSKDPFALAAVRDAEKTADNVSLQNRFPLTFPLAAITTVAVTIAALLAWALLPQFDLFGVEQRRVVAQQKHEAQQHEAVKAVKEAIVAIDSAPREVATNEKIELAKHDLTRLLEQHAVNAPQARQRAQETLKAIEAIKQQIKDAKHFEQAQREFENMKNVGAPPPEETGPVADAHRALSDGKPDEAMNQLKKAVDNFDKMDKKEQDKAAEQMKNLANQIAKNANDPKVQQQIQQQLQQAGASQQMAQQMAQAMQQAANGNQQAQQQLQQMANQAIQQANQQQGMSQKQQQAVAQAMKQAMQAGQQQANAQANAQQMAQAAQAMAQAMQQAAGAQGQQPGSNKGQQGQANAGQQAQQGQGQQGQQGKNGQGQGGGSKQQMQQQLAQLQAMAKDAQAVAAGQQGQGQQGQGQGQPGQNGQGQGGQQQANGQWGQNGQGQFQQGNPQQNQGQGGQGGAAIAAGGKRPDPTEAAFGVKQELSQSQTNEDGKILASSFVRAPAERGSSKIALSQAIESERKEATDEVDQDRIPRGAQKAVKEYFETLKAAPPVK